MRTISLLGSTGSVGRSAIAVLDELEATHRVVSLVAHTNTELLLKQAERLRPEVVGIVDQDAGRACEPKLRALGCRVIVGQDAAVLVLRERRPDLVLAAITGAAGLPSSLETVRLGATLALANKEALVMAGSPVMELARSTRASIVPVDSEHSAVFQSIGGEPIERVRRIFLTASGGPFADLPAASFATVTPEQALQHPTWQMGRKITIDSASMMNKALEIVEAHWLFGLDADRIDVLVHRQSVVHSMVEFVDGSILAQLGVPSMTVPIRYALSYPSRSNTREGYFDLAKFAKLTFEAPDLDRFPALRLGHEVARAGGLAGAVLNASNEVAVDAFLARRTSFDRIPAVAGDVLERMTNVAHPTLDQILAADAWAREETRRCLSIC
ncbi:MAG: 1-deoxy-D-xylulose-5-phosphate reductoisomerase [Planctomycetes bacterium]|nr:1-deoxy-D-xylulose-5-phosphate reductoisomerase [Planctomycetota bacterium]